MIATLTASQSDGGYVNYRASRIGLQNGLGTDSLLVVR